MRVLLVSTGLGKINRGFESFFLQLYVALKKYSIFDVYLAQGSLVEDKDKDTKKIFVPNFHRNGFIAKSIAKLKKKHFNFYSYLIEEYSFFLMVLPWIILKRPDVIIFSERNFGNALFKTRKLFNLNYKLIFSNGGPLPPHDYILSSDFVHQTIPLTYKEAFEAGFKKERMMLIPYGFDLNMPDLKEDNESIKRKLNLPLNKKIILCVGAINSYHKRTDYVIRECKKSLISNESILICLGQMEADSFEILKEFEFLINENFLFFRTVKPEEVRNYYQIADVFVLGSLAEGFGRVIVEAIGYGLPVILHNTESFKYVGREFASYVDMSEVGSLELGLEKKLKNLDSDKNRIANAINKIYSWDALINDYIEIINKTKELPMIK